MRRAVLILLLPLIALVSCGSTSTRAKAAPFTQPGLIPVRYQNAERYQVSPEWRVAVHGTDHTIPAGLIVDGASVPRILWPFMSPDGLHRAGALFHDWGYVNKGALPDGHTYTRRELDEAFKALMLKAGVTPWRADVAYAGVRMAGWSVWNRPKEPLAILPVTQRASLQPQRSRTVLSHIFAP